MVSCRGVWPALHVSWLKASSRQGAMVVVLSSCELSRALYPHVVGFFLLAPPMTSHVRASPHRKRRGVISWRSFTYCFDARMHAWQMGSCEVVQWCE